MSDEPSPDLSEEALERELRRAASTTRYPPTPPIAAAVRHRLSTEREAAPGGFRSRSSWIARARRGRPAVLALAVLLIAASGVVAVAFGIPGLRIAQVSAPPSPNVPNDPLHVRESLGIPTDLEGARSGVDFPILVPPARGRPDEVYLGSTNRNRGRVVLLYRALEEPTLTGDIGLLITEFAAQLDTGFDTKWVAEGDTRVQYVDVNGARGYWISGAPHVYAYLNEIAGIQGRQLRQVGDVLVWERAGIVYRIEARLGLDQTLALARSLR